MPVAMTPRIPTLRLLPNVLLRLFVVIVRAPRLRLVLAPIVPYILGPPNLTRLHGARGGVGRVVWRRTIAARSMAQPGGVGGRAHLVAFFG